MQPWKTDIYILTSCEMVTYLLDRTPCISDQCDHHWYHHLGKATFFFWTYWFCFHVKFMIWLTFQFAKWKTIGKWIAKVSVTCLKVVWLHKKLVKELRTLIYPNWHEAGHIYPPCNFGIGFCQLILSENFPTFFGSENWHQSGHWVL